MSIRYMRDESFGRIILIIDVRRDKLFDEVYPPLHRETRPISYHSYRKPCTTVWIGYKRESLNQLLSTTKFVENSKPCNEIHLWEKGIKMRWDRQRWIENNRHGDWTHSACRGEFETLKAIGQRKCEVMKMKLEGTHDYKNTSQSSTHFNLVIR